MMTKRNSIITAPVYTMTWAMPRNGAEFVMYRIARVIMVSAIHRAQCTALRDVTRPMAPSTEKIAQTQKITASPVLVGVSITESPPDQLHQLP